MGGPSGFDLHFELGRSVEANPIVPSLFELCLIVCLGLLGGGCCSPIHGS